MSDEGKTCTGCHQAKPQDCFHKKGLDKTGIARLSSTCKECANKNRVGRYQKKQAQKKLAILIQARADLMQKSGLESLEKTALEFIARFDELTGIQKRHFIERMIAKVVIKEDNQLELHVLWDPKKSVTRTTKSSISKGSGGAMGSYANYFLSNPFIKLLRRITLFLSTRTNFLSSINI